MSPFNSTNLIISKNSWSNPKY